MLGLALAIIVGLTAPGALAQDAGVSGVPPGPGNARGLNGSVSDPSGSAATVPSVAPPSISPVTPPGISAPAPARPYAARGGLRGGRMRFSRLSPEAAQAAMKERERLLDKLHGICRGC